MYVFALYGRDFVDMTRRHLILYRGLGDAIYTHQLSL